MECRFVPPLLGTTLMALLPDHQHQPCMVVQVQLFALWGDILRALGDRVPAVPEGQARGGGGVSIL